MDNPYIIGIDLGTTNSLVSCLLDSWPGFTSNLEDMKKCCDTVSSFLEKTMGVYDKYSLLNAMEKYSRDSWFNKRFTAVCREVSCLNPVQKTDLLTSDVFDRIMYELAMQYSHLVPPIRLYGI